MEEDTYADLSAAIGRLTRSLRYPSGSNRDRWLPLSGAAHVMLSASRWEDYANAQVLFSRAMKASFGEADQVLFEGPRYPTISVREAIKQPEEHPVLAGALEELAEVLDGSKRRYHEFNAGPSRSVDHYGLLGRR